MLLALLVLPDPMDMLKCSKWSYKHIETYLYSSNVADKQHVEGYRECNNQQYGHEYQFKKCPDDIEEHVDGYPSPWHVFQKDYDVEPCQEHSQSSNLPLPWPSTPAAIEEPENKYDGETEHTYLEVVLECQEILPSSAKHLDNLHD